MPQVVKYKIEEGRQNRVEFGRRQDNLLLQLFPFRVIESVEAMRQDDNAPTVRIINAIDQYNPKHVKTQITVPNETLDIPFYTIEFKEFYKLPTDTDYLREKITKALRDLVL